MNKFNFQPAWLAAAVAMTAFSASAIEVVPIIKQIRMDTPRENYITIKSSFPASADKEKYEFVTLDLFRVTNPGEAKEKVDRELEKSDPTLIFSPTKVVVPYGEQKKIRVMTLKPVEKEQIYRLRVRPSYPEDAIEPGKVRFAIGYDVLIRYLPNGSLSQEFKVDCKGGSYRFEALGNSRTEVRNVKADGAAYEDINVYPGHARSIKASRELAFEVDGKTYRYVNCSLQG